MGNSVALKVNICCVSAERISPFNVESLYTGWIGSFCPTQLSGGARRDRTADLLRATQALSQLSYSPKLNLL